MPDPLRCLTDHYVGEGVIVEGAWWLRLPDGSQIPYDDGRVKSPSQRIDQPDIQDVFAVPYPTGPIRPIADEAHDPGRARLEALFRATYGATAVQVQSALLTVRIHGRAVPVHRKVREAFRRVAAKLEQAIARDSSLDALLRAFGGTFNWRTIAGTKRLSAHAWGIAIDLDPSKSDYWRNGGVLEQRKRHAIPQAIVDAFESEGFVWGGRWFHYDTMHFEFRPELLDSSCYPARQPILTR